MDAQRLTSPPGDLEVGTPAPPGGGRQGSAHEDVRVLLVATLLGGAAVHAGVVREHVAHWPAAGLFFVLLAVSGLVLGAALLRSVDRRRLLAALTLSVGPLLVWFVSRTAGLPFGPEAGEPERVSFADAAACLLAVAGAGAGLFLLRASPRLDGRTLPAAVQRTGLGAVALVTVVGLTSATLTEPVHGGDPAVGHRGGEHGLGGHHDVEESLVRPAGGGSP